MTDRPVGGWLAALPRQLVAGLVVGVMGVSVALSFATLVFKGDLASSLGRGTGWVLTGLVVTGVVTALTSSFRGLASGPQDAPAVVLAAAATGIVAGAVEPLATLATFIMVTGLCTGLLLVVMGGFKLGDLVRYVPYPVVAGFLGGTGAVLFLAGIDQLFASGGPAEIGLLIVPGIALGLAIALAGRFGKSPLVSVFLIVAGFVGYHLAAIIAGISRAEGIARGLLLGPFPEGGLADFGVVTEIAAADWGAVSAQLPAIVVMALIVPLAVLLNVGGLEQTFRVDIDVDRELRAAGAAMVVTSPFAGIPGYAFLSASIVGRRLGGAGRIPPLIAAGFAAAVLFVGPDLVSLVPVLIPAGILLGVGIDLLLSWVWDLRRRVTWPEYVVILGIVVTVAVLGFLPGVGLGLVAATVLFVVRYARTSAVRTLSTISDRRSNVQRNAAEEAVLAELGERVVLVELQGFLFFGTGEQLVRAARRAFETGPDVDLVLIDLRRVTGMDSSVVASFERLGRLAETHGLLMVISGAGDSLLELLGPVLEGEHFEYRPDLDRAIEMAEERLLASSSVAAQDESVDWGDVPSVVLPAGEPIITEGERGAGIFFLESGRASVESPEGRRAVLLPGAVVGELSHLTGDAAMATVICEVECVVRHISEDWMAELARTDPQRALEFERLVARRLATKLNAANRTIRSLQ